MKYELQDLLRVREHRKEHAQEILLKAKMALQEAQRLLEEQKKKQERFLEKKPEYIQLIYDQMLQKTHFKRNYLDLVNLKLSKLDEYQEKLAIEIEKAHNKYEQAQQEVVQCSRKLHKAQRELEKIEEHKNIWKEDMRLLDEKEQDKELEDFKVKK